MSQVNDLQAIRDFVEKNLEAGPRLSAFSYLDKLPDLYAGLAQTCESRFVDHILRHVQAVLRLMPTVPVSDELIEKFSAMHEANGIPRLALKLSTPSGKAGPKKRPAARLAGKS